MLNWKDFLLKEDIDQSEIEMIDREESEYLKFKNFLRMKGSAQGLEDYSPPPLWRFTFESSEGLTRGKAIIEAKTALFDRDDGVNAYFDTQNQLKVEDIEAQQEGDHWTVTMDFRCKLLEDKYPTEESGFDLIEEEDHSQLFHTSLTVMLREPGSEQDAMKIAKVKLERKIKGGDLMEKIQIIPGSVSATPVDPDENGLSNRWHFYIEFDGVSKVSTLNLRSIGIAPLE